MEPRSSGRDTVQTIPVEPNARLIISGLLILLLGGWLALSFLPDHRPLSETEIALTITDAALNKSPDQLRQLTGWHLKEGPYRALWGLTVLLLVAGVYEVITGALWRAHLRVWCRECREEVIARKRAWGAWCSRHHGWARIYVAKVVAAVVITGIGLLFLVKLVQGVG